MELLRDGVIAFLSAVGLTTCFWLAAGPFFAGRCRNPEVMLILPVRGDAPAMESDLKELLRAHRTLPGAAIILLDEGLNAESRDLAEYFCQKYRAVQLKGAAEFKKK